MTIRLSRSPLIFGLVLSIHALLMAGMVRGESISIDEYGTRIQDTVEYLESKDGTLRQEEISYLDDVFPKGFMVRDST